MSKYSFSLICMVVNTLSLIAYIIVLAIILNLLTVILGISGEGIGAIEVVLLTILLAVFSSPISLIPSYFINMKIARYLREKRGWVIDRPRRYFAYSILVPIVLFGILAILNTVMQ